MADRNYQFWQDLVSFVPPASTERRLKQGEYIQLLDRHAKGTVANLDFFAVRISEFPQSNGRRLTASELLTYMRLHFNDFLENRWADFVPPDGPEWRSPDPSGSVAYFKMYDPGGLIKHVDNGSVVVSDVSPQSWTFSTANTWAHSDHPVSGHRQFGFIPLKDGTCLVYTRGGDRPTGWLDAQVAGIGFETAENLWRGWQAKLAGWVKKLGGDAKIAPPVIARPLWDDVRQRFYHPSESLLAQPRLDLLKDFIHNRPTGEVISPRRWRGTRSRPSDAPQHRLTPPEADLRRRGLPFNPMMANRNRPSMPFALINTMNPANPNSPFNLMNPANPNSPLNPHHRMVVRDHMHRQQEVHRRVSNHLRPNPVPGIGLSVPLDRHVWRSRPSGFHLVGPYHGAQPQHLLKPSLLSRPPKGQGFYVQVTHLPGHPKAQGLRNFMLPGTKFTAVKR
jgi:hypothetical protein